MITPDENQPAPQVTVNEALKQSMQASVAYAKVIANNNQMPFIYVPLLFEFEAKDTGITERGFCIAATGDKAKTDGLFSVLHEAAAKYLGEAQ